jgi:NADPH-dependent 2,4-dienoyl-CoA reductase/sulfur reductase-like enzyme/nitrite reductase/ring-hydroxylating ferredoxin subunit
MLARSEAIMTSEPAKLTGPDFAEGIDIAELAEGKALLGQTNGEAVVVVRRGSEFFAVGATCSHYGGPLAKGLVENDTIRCPWHHACFSLRTGEPEAPALNSIDCYAVERRGDRLYVLAKRQTSAGKQAHTGIQNVVIIGGGAAGLAAAEMLRREGYAGRISMLSADSSGPVDRPNLSKDYLAGTAPEEWIPLRPADFFAEQSIDLELEARVESLDARARTVTTQAGKTYAFDALLLATGAEPVRLTIPGADCSHVHYLRSLSDCRAIIEKAKTAKSVVVIGSSFIGLEVAAALRMRELPVHVVAPDGRPLERIMGPEIGDAVRALHEGHGVVFHLGNTVQSIGNDSVLLANGDRIACDLVVVGIGVKPRIELAEKAGLTIDRGVVVNEYLETSAAGVYAAGDIARWPDPHSGQNIRVEHWAVAQRQGQLAARNMLGQKRPCAIVPYFWSQHYDVTIAYVGHAERWDNSDISGDPTQGDCTVALRADKKTLAVVTIGRDIESLQAEAAFERHDERHLASLGK